MTAENVVALFVTMLVLSAVPGPSDFAVVARSLTAGFSHGLCMVGGILLGDFVFILVALYSLDAVAETMGPLYVVVKFLCGGFLVWMGISAWRAKARPPALGTEPGERTRHSRLSSFLSGWLITMGDPKAILFYMGLFPAYLDLSEISMTDALTIMLLATVVICGVKLTYAWLADRARRWFENTRLMTGLNRVAGTVLVGTGLFLIIRG